MRRAIFAASAAALAIAGAACAQGQPVTITATPLGSGITMLQGRGGNIAIVDGGEKPGVLMVDSQFATVAPLIEAKITEVAGEGGVDVLINTHYHRDHVDGNAYFAARGATIIAHANVRPRLIAPPISTFSGEAQEAQPTEAFADIDVTGDTVIGAEGLRTELTFWPNAHTDGDIWVYWPEANVLHMGDLFFNGLFPYIDTNAGGGIDGYIAAQRAALALGADDLVIIPGHGPLATKADLARNLEVLEGVRAAVQAQIDTGASLEAAIAAKPLAEWDEAYGQAFIRSDKMVEIVYGDLSGR